MPDQQPFQGALIERNSELAALSGAISAASRGTGRLVIVRGGGGLGKTSLLDGAIQAAGERGLTVLRAIGSDLERALPFGVAIALLRRAATGPSAPPDLLTGSARIGGALLAGRADLDLLAGGEAAQMALIHSLHWIAVNLGDERPLLLVVDDAHWADRPSLRLLAYLARRISEFPIALLVGMRPREPGADTETLDALTETPGATILDLAPLSTRATETVLGRLLARTPAPAFTEACVEVTGGNPMLLRELTRALRDEECAGDPQDVARVRRIGPEPVAASVRATLRHLPAAASDLAHTISLMHEPVDVELAIELSGLERARARSLLGDLERTGVLVAADGLRLAHPLVRQALARTLPAGERAALHAHAAELHAGRGEYERAAAHLLHVPPRGQDWAAQALVAAAERASARATPRRAVELLTRALQEPPPREIRAAVLTATARAQTIAGDPAASNTLAQAIDANAATGDRAEQASLLLELAWLRAHQGRFEDAVATARRGLSLNPPESVRLELLDVHDNAQAWSPRYGALSAAPSSLPAAAAAASGSRGRRVALSAAAMAGMLRGEDRERTAALALGAWASGRLLDDADADDPLLIRPVSALLCADRFADVASIIEPCLRDAERRGSPMAHATWVHLRGQILFWGGRLAEAELDLTEAFSAREYGWGAFLPFTARELSSLYVEHGDLPRARRVLEEARAAGVHGAESLMWGAWESALGVVLLAEGRPEEALRAFDRAVALAAGVGASNPATDPLRIWAVAALNRLGRVQEAIARADQELARARGWGAPRTLGLALRLRATLAGSTDERRALLDEAVTVLDGSEATLEFAHALFAAARFAQVTGDPDARDQLRQALDLALRCGATALAERAGQALRDAGGRPRRVRTTGPASLTPSEVRVAERAAAGHSNREIAQELFVTPKAVAFHLGNVYRKLGISGRGALADALRVAA